MMVKEQEAWIKINWIETATTTTITIMMT